MNDLALFMDALRAAVPAQPDPRLGGELVPRLAETARAATIEAETQATRRQPRSRLGLVARVGIAVAAIPLLLAGLAFAGVTVPQPARTAFDKVGITLPNQPSEHAAATTAPGHTKGIKGSENSSTESGAGSQGNSAAAHQHALEQHKKAQGKAKGHEIGKAIGLNELPPPGKSGDTGPPDHSNAGGGPPVTQSAPGQLNPHVPQGQGKGNSH